MPPIPIVDAHVHLWNPDEIRLEWLDNNELLNQPYDLAEYNAHTAGIEIAAMVYAQVEAVPAYGLLEARWVSTRARMDPRLQGIVAWAPVEYGERTRTYLDALVAIDPKIKGVRRLLQTEADPAYGLQPNFVRGVQILGEYGLSFDLGVNWRQVGSVAELVRRCPNTQFMLDHIGMPSIKTNQREPWWDDLMALAALPNVMCKISGVTTAADWKAWTIDDIAPYVAHALDAFGEDRVVYAGDWPVVLQASSYRRWVETLDTLTAHLSLSARRKLWAENARRFYRLPAA